MLKRWNFLKTGFYEGIKLGCLVDPAIRQRERDREDLVSVEEFVKFAHGLRLDTIDFHLFNVSLDHEELFSLKRLSHRYGLPISYIGRSGGLFGHEIQPGRVTVEMACREVDGALTIGAPMTRLRIGGPPVARTPGGELIEEYWPGMIERLQQICDYAAGKGVLVGVQNHDSGAPICTADDVLRMISEVGRENFAYIMDCGQWMGSPGGNPIGEVDPDVDIYAYMERVAPYASCVRAKIYRIDDGHEEWIDYDRIIRILKDVGYNGAISMVFELQPDTKATTPDAVRMATAHLRELLAKYGV